MKSFAVSLALIMVTIAAPVCGQSETTALSASLKVTQSNVCQASSSCEGTEKAAFSLQQSFEISPMQEAQIGSDTSVTIELAVGLQVNVRVGDDPNYQVGDQSATINSEAFVVTGPVDTQVKLSWKNGIFTVSAKGNATRPTSTGPVLPIASAAGPSALPPANPLGTLSQSVDLEDAGGIFATTTAFIACQIIQNVKATPIANSAIKVGVQVSVKSKYQVAEPL